MASVSWLRIRSSSLEAFVLDGVGWFPGTQVLEWGIEWTIVDFRKVVHSLGGATQGPDIDRTRQPAISLLFWHILSCGMGCCLEHRVCKPTFYTDDFFRFPSSLILVYRNYNIFTNKCQCHLIICGLPWSSIVHIEYIWIKQ